MQAAPSKPRQPCKPQSQAQQGLQKGFVAVLLLVMLAVAAIAAFTKGVWGGEDANLKERQLTRQALQQAKEALLNYVEVGDTTDFATLLANAAGTGLGHLPCTDLNGDGFMTVACGNDIGGTNAADVHSLGLLPWRTLGISALRDGANECLWYAVSGSHKSATRRAVINADTPAPFSIIQPVKNINPITGAVTWMERVLAGNTAAGILPASSNRVVAVIISPGSARAQNRTRLAASRECPLPVARAGVPNAEASAVRYLENYTGTTINADNSNTPAAANARHIFVQADVGQERLNDELIWITAEEFAQASSKRALKVMAKAIDAYIYGFFDTTAAPPTYVPGNGVFPGAASAPGGVCVAGRVQGFVPHTCPAAVGGVPALNMGGLGVGQLWTDWWRIHAHYAVSENCLAPRPAGLGAITTPPFLVANPPTNVCAPGVRVAVGDDLNSVHALILMRGLQKVGQGCSINPAVLPINLELCIEDPANAAVVTAGNIVAPMPATIIGTNYQPVRPNSNDLMHIFRQRTQ